MINEATGEDYNAPSGGHSIKEDDYWFMTRELRTHFSCLSGRLYSLIEELGLPEKQESAAKRHLKTEVWERYNDFCKSMRTESRVRYLQEAPWGIPDEE